MPVLVLLASSATPPFREVAEQAGVHYKHFNSPTSQKYPIEIMGSGVALIDMDSDGWLDLYLVNGARLEDPMPSTSGADKSRPETWNRLYRNLGNGTFQDVTATAGVAGSGYGMGAAVGDYDNDGDPDLYVTNYGPNLLYTNNGDGTFTDVTKQSGTEDPGWSTSAAFFDADGDGDLDLYVASYATFSFDSNPYCGERKPGYRAYCHPDEFEGSQDHLYRNNGDGTFSDVSQASGIARLEGKGLGVVTGDYNLDGLDDIYVANDKVSNFLFKAVGKGVFEESGFFANVSYSRDGLPQAGMGVDMGDFDGDGLPDLVVTNLSFEGTSLYHNQGDGSFSEVSLESGLGESLLMVGFGTRFFDLDNDSDLDILMVNGHVMDNIGLYQDQLTFAQPKQLFENVAGRFVHVAATGDSVLARPAVGRAAAFGDLNNDGGVDVVVGNCGESLQILLNQVAERGNWLLLDPVGTRSNRDAVGIVVKILRRDEPPLLRAKHGGASYLSSHDPRLHIGLGNEKVVDLEIRWPSGCVQKLEKVKANQILRVSEPSGGADCQGHTSPR